MKNSKNYMAVLNGALLLAVSVLISTPFPLKSQDLPSKLSPMIISGSSQVFMYTHVVASPLGNWISLRRDSNPIRNAEVKVETKILNELRPGYYAGQLDGFKIDPNRLIHITITPERTIPSIARVEPVTAQARLVDIMEIVSPSSREWINLAEVTAITVRWRYLSGSGRISKLILQDSGGNNIFEHDNILGNSFDISTSYFLPNKAYHIWLLKNNPDYTFNGNVDPKSHLELIFSTEVLFFTK